MSRAHACDACGRGRLTWQRLCAACWPRLAHDLRDRLILAAKRGEKAAHRAAKRECRAALRTAPANPVPPQQAYRLAAAITGERDL